MYTTHWLGTSACQLTCSLCISCDTDGDGDGNSDHVDARPPMISKGTKERAIVIILYLSQWGDGQYELEDCMQWKWVLILLLKHMSIF